MRLGVRGIGLFAALALLPGCGEETGTDDAGARDGSVRMDAAVTDGGSGADAAVDDAGVRDGAVFDGAVFDGAILDGAVFDGAVFDGAILDGAGPDAAPIDAAALDASSPDAGSGDAGRADGGVGAFDACIPPPCPAPPPGCSYVGGTACTCGTLVCAGTCDGVTCSSTEYCAYATPYACSGAGACQARPGGCPAVYDPVCGCDGSTYSNACVARQNGTDVAATGACAAPADCRTAGCPSGETCEPCRGPAGAVWICLPAGVAC